MRVTFPVHLIFLDFIILMIFDEECKVTDFSDVAPVLSSSERAIQQCNDASFLTSCLRNGNCNEYNKRLRIHLYKLEGSCYQIFSQFSPTVLCFRKSYNPISVLELGREDLLSSETPESLVFMCACLLLCVM
jgi:hypothetical protein